MLSVGLTEGKCGSIQPIIAKKETKFQMKIPLPSREVLALYFLSGWYPPTWNIPADRHPAHKEMRPNLVAHCPLKRALQVGFGLVSQDQRIRTFSCKYKSPENIWILAML